MLTMTKKKKNLFCNSQKKRKEIQLIDSQLIFDLRSGLREKKKFLQSKPKKAPPLNKMKINNTRVLIGFFFSLSIYSSIKEDNNFDFNPKS